MRRFIVSLLCLVLVQTCLAGAIMAESNDSYWVKRFDQYDQKQKQDNDGAGYTGPFKDVSYAPSERYGWDESYVLKGYLGMYQATKKTAYLDHLVSDFDKMTAQLEDFDKDGLKSWWTWIYSIPLVINGDFESDTIYYFNSDKTAYMPDGWYPYPWYEGKGHVYRTDQEKKKGKYSMAVENDGKEMQATYTVLPNYTKNKTYRVMFDAKTKTDSDPGKVMIVRQDTGKPIAVKTFTGTDWTSYTFDFVAPDTEGLQLRVYLTNADINSKTATSYYDNVQVMQYGEYIEHEGMVWESVSNFINMVKNDKSLSGYADKADSYLKLFESNVYKRWMQYWKEWDDNGQPKGVLTFPFDDTARMTQITEYYPFNVPSKGITLPHNRYAAAGRAIVNVYKTTQNADYLDKAVRMANFFKGTLTEQSTPGGNGYVFQYWNSSGQPWDYGYFRYKFEDISHGDIELGFAMDMYKIGKVFTIDDMKKFSNTFKYLIWKGDFDNPRVSTFVNGSGSQNYAKLVTEWINLSQFDPEIRRISIALLRNPNDFGPTYGMNVVGNLLAQNPDLLTNPYDGVFVDTVGHWAKKEIEQLYAKSVVSGVTNTRFEPDSTLTRAQFAVMVEKLLGYSDSVPTGFSDIDAKNWFAGAAGSLIQKQIMAGKADGVFAPNDTVSRQEMAVILNNVIKKESKKTLPEGKAAEQFSDYSAISDWAKASIDAVVNAKIMEGAADGMFMPKQPVTRAQAAVAMSRLSAYLQ